MKHLKIFTLCFLLCFLIQSVYSYDSIASAQRKCSHGGAMCSQPHPAQPCIGGMAPGSDCVCYTDFTLQFQQEVELGVNVLDTDCGSATNFHFYVQDLSTSSWAIDEIFSGMGIHSRNVTLAAGNYRLIVDRMGQPGGNYSVSYWGGPPNCSANLSMSNTDFNEVNSGNCSGWRTLTFENNGNMPFSGIGIASGDPAFVLDTTGMPTTLDPTDDFTFEARFCPPAGLTTDTPYSAFITVSYTCNGSSQSRQVTVSGMGHVPRGELSVASVFDVGEADWTLPSPGNRVQRSLRIDNMGDAAMTVSVSITNDGGGVFSLPSGGSVGSINGGSHASVLVRATVFAETIYTGQLRVEATYGGGFSDTDYVELRARGHHPVPVLHLYTTEINYGEVERDYHYHQAVKIGNDGDAPLTFEISLQDPSDPDAGDFTLDLGNKGPIGQSGSQLYEMTFHPSSNGAKEVFLVIENTNEEPPTSRTVRLYGTGTDPVPLSTMLVIDRSGSMDGMAGTVRKIEAARDSGNLYATLIMRDNLDWLGITKYNQNASTPVPLAPISSNLGAAQSLLNDIGGQMLPDGSTGIGGAMQTAAAEFSSSPADNGMAMIVLTDGKENEEPWIDDVKQDIKDANPNLHIYCVGIGDPIETGPYGIDGIETSKLQAIADEFEGMFRVIQSISGEQRYDLEEFYFKVFAQASGRQIALDPLYFLSFSTTIQFVSSVEIVTCDRDADFLLISDLFRIPDLKFHIILQDPTGQIIETGSTVGGIGVHVKTLDKYKLIRVKFPPRSQSDAYAGRWDVFLKPVGERTSAVVDKYVNTYPSYGGNVPIAFMVSVGSDYRLDASLTPGEVLVGEPVHISAKTTEAWWPIPGADVKVTITKPDGSTANMNLFDDGAHGDGEASDAIYGANFIGAQKGYHEFHIRSHGLTERNEDVTREMTLSKYIGKSLPERPDRECIPCWLLRLIIIIILILLILILFWLFYCCCRRKLIG